MNNILGSASTIVCTGLLQTLKLFALKSNKGIVDIFVKTENKPNLKYPTFWIPHQIQARCVVYTNSDK